MWRSSNPWMGQGNLPFADTVSYEPVARHSESRRAREWIRVQRRDGQRGWLESDSADVVYANYYDVEPRGCGGP